MQQQDVAEAVRIQQIEREQQIKVQDAEIQRREGTDRHSVEAGRGGSPAHRRPGRRREGPARGRGRTMRHKVMRVGRLLDELKARRTRP
jgi:hypothetical protein